MNKQEALQELSYLIWDVSHPDEWDTNSVKEWESLQISIAKLITYIESLPDEL